MIEPHLRGYRRCSTVYDRTLKLLIIAGDERIFELPADFTARLRRFLDRAILKGSPSVNGCGVTTARRTSDSVRSYEQRSGELCRV